MITPRSVPGRLIAAFATMVVFLVALGVFSVASQRRLMRQLTRLDASCGLANDLLRLLEQAHTEATIAVGSRNPAVGDHHTAVFRTAADALRRLSAGSTLDRQRLRALLDRYDQALLYHSRFAYELAYRELTAALPEHERAVAQVTSSLEAAEIEKETTLERSARQGTWATAVLAALALATALFLAWFLQRDFVDRRRAEASLAAALARLQSVLDSAEQVVIVMADPAGVVQVFNQGAEDLLGWTAAEVVGRMTPLAWYAPEEVVALRRELADQGLEVASDFDAITLRARLHGSERRRWVAVARSGERHPTDLVVTRVDDGQGALVGFLGVAVDRTQQEEAERALRAQEERLRQAQRLESIGQLAAGVAHDFNNLLTVIQGNAAMLEPLQGGDPEREALTAEIREAAVRASNLTRQLLLFSRKQRMQVRPVQLNALAGELLKMLARLLGEHITLEFALAPDLPDVLADPGMLEQVIVNLAVNARDAMPEGGRLRIATAAVEAAERPGQAQSPCVRLVVSDTGCGISPELQGRIFDPFFTTKEVGKGTGLGLSTVYGIVRQHGGWIELESAVGVGTTFRILLPAAPAGAQAAAPPAPPRTERPRGGGRRTVLVVEDEPALRQLASRVLGAEGYRVLTAASGAEALGLPGEVLATVDLLLTDLVMPGGVDGRELARALRERYPTLRVLFSSGYSPEAGGAAPSDGEPFLPKPYDPETLLAAAHAAVAS